MHRVKYVVVGVITLCISVGFGAFENQLLRIGTPGEVQEAPYFYGDMDAAGYSDWIWYGPTDIHEHWFHEVLSGEWGAAIYYDGIDTEPTADPNDDATRKQAMWLTKDFVYANWGTNSDFRFGGTCAAWSDNNNPVPNNDTGRSVIRNDQVQITIDYEVVDLSTLSLTYSPMTYLRDPNTGAFGQVFSDRYLFLQTYTIKNLKNESLTGLEFYQFLHSHGANEYAPRVNSTYCDASVSDPLAGYVPYNSVHQTGNFRYDITQWNSPPYGTESHVDHVDYVSFSSTVEPDWIDNDVYDSIHDYTYDKRTYGSHFNVENRDLNGVSALYLAEVGGAMGWSMGSLDPNETTSMTIAFMFAPKQDSSLLTLTKRIKDPQDSYCPGDTLTYVLEWENLSPDDALDAVLTDFIPAGLTYEQGEWTIIFDPNFQMLPPDPQYTSETRSYQWEIGTIPANSSGSIELTLTVNENAEPGMTVRNEAILETSLGSASAYHYTPICCWDESGIIYVDCQATGANIGTSWHNAYTDLQSALARATLGCGTEIRVAQGTYDPGRVETTSFILPNNVSVYGGFPTGGCDFSLRNFKRYVTILAGNVDALPNATVVRMGDNTVLDGFTVRGAATEEGYSYGVYGTGVDFSLVNCVIENNDYYGIRAIEGDVSLQWCYVRGNGFDGISHSGTGYTLSIDNCWIMKQMGRGVYCINSTPICKNSIISESDLAEAGNEGIRISNPAHRPVLYNVTMAYNRAEAVFFEDNRTIDDPNDKDWPDAQNCILWNNNGGNDQFSGFDRQHIQYSCIYDPNDPLGLDETKDVNDNFSTNPEFAYSDPNNIHIKYSSPCKDAGSTWLDYEGQADFDGKERVIGLSADVGAYEIECEDISNELDWNADGLVNLYEFNFFSRAWLSHDPNDPAWTDPNVADPNLSEGWYEWKYKCNLADAGNSQYTIDLADLAAFLDAPWLWRACWMSEDYLLEMPAAESEMLMLDEQMQQFSTDFTQVEEWRAIPEPQDIQPEPTIKEQIVQLHDAIVFLEQIWLEEPELQQEIDAEDWQVFLASIYQNLFDLQTEAVQLE